MRLALSVTLALLIAPACSRSESDTADEGEGPGDDQPAPDAEPGTPDAVVAEAADATPPAPGFAALYQAVIAPRCAGCHGEMGAAGLSLTAADSARANLVDVVSVTPECGGRPRVVPGDADASLLVSKVDGTHLCGQLMPIGEAPLPADQIAMIRDWIEGGALP